MDESDEMYLKLKGIRERACRLQVLVRHQEHRDALQVVCDTTDRLGIFYAPAQWSNFDLPELPPTRFDYSVQFDEEDDA